MNNPKKQTKSEKQLQLHLEIVMSEFRHDVELEYSGLGRPDVNVFQSYMNQLMGVVLAWHGNQHGKNKEKIIQIIKDGTYYLALTDKGRILCGDAYLDGGSDSAIFWSKVEEDYE